MNIAKCHLIRSLDGCRFAPVTTCVYLRTLNSRHKTNIVYEFVVRQMSNIQNRIWFNKNVVKFLAYESIEK